MKSIPDALSITRIAKNPRAENSTICSSRGDEAQISLLKYIAVGKNEPSYVGCYDFSQKRLSGFRQNRHL
jgi:hypothetical protein